MLQLSSSKQARATFGHSIGRVWLRVEIVILATLTLNIVCVCSDDLASLALWELTHVDPNLLVVSATEVTLMHICLVVHAAYDLFVALLFCLGSKRHLSPEAHVTPRYVWYSLHAGLNELAAWWTLIGYQRWIEWPHPLALCAAHLALFLEDVERLYCVVTKQAWCDANVWDTLWSIATVALSTSSVRSALCQLLCCILLPEV